MSTVSTGALLTHFDGVIHSYTSGWKGASGHSDGTPWFPARFILSGTLKSFLLSQAFTHSRSGQVGGIGAMQRISLRPCPQVFSFDEVALV